MCTGSSIDGLTDALTSPTRHNRTPAHRMEEEDDSAAGTGSEEADAQSDDSGEGGSSSSAGASDLEGIPVACGGVAADAGPSVPKRSKPGTAQSITEEGAESKIGIVFSRILEKRTKQGVLAVRNTSRTCYLARSSQRLKSTLDCSLRRDRSNSSEGCLMVQGSKSVQKRRREDEAEAALRSEAKQQRQQLTSRDRKPVLQKGQDPSQDAREKTLMTVATKYAALHSTLNSPVHACLWVPSN